MRKKKGNYLDYTPSRIRNYDRDEDGRVEVTVPRFGAWKPGRWIQGAFKLNDFKIKLDEIGTYIWDRCDGKNTVYEIGLEMKERFGEKIEPVYERLALFVKQMERGKLIEVRQHEPHES